MLSTLVKNHIQRFSIIVPSFCRLANQKRTCNSQNKLIYNMDEENHLVWVDLEMTGLDDQKDKILEIACLITDTNLKLVAEGPDIVINQPGSILESMDQWCQEHHGQSGLTKAVQESSTSVQQAEEEVLDFAKKYTKPKKCLLAGNSVHVDKAFLNKYMPKFMNHLHYRIIDVSTVKELCKYWHPKIYEKAPRKAGSHRALDDIKESLEELKFYRSTMFK